MTANTNKLAMTFNDETGIHIKYTTLKISEIIAEDKELAIKTKNQRNSSKHQRHCNKKRQTSKTHQRSTK